MTTGRPIMFFRTKAAIRVRRRLPADGQRVASATASGGTDGSSISERCSESTLRRRFAQDLGWAKNSPVFTS